MSISVDGLTTYTDASDYSAQTTKLENSLKNTDYSNATEEELMDACKEFEAYFIEQVYKAMEKMVPKNEEEEDSSVSKLTDYFKDEMMQDYAKMTADQGSLGLAEQLYEQMKRNYNL